jgi:hypothetical protein
LAWLAIRRVMAMKRIREVLFGSSLQKKRGGFCGLFKVWSLSVFFAFGSSSAHAASQEIKSVPEKTKSALLAFFSFKAGDCSQIQKPDLNSPAVSDQNVKSEDPTSFRIPETAVWADIAQ